MAYLDREKTIKSLEDALSYIASDNRTAEINNIVRKISMLPTADVAEVKHGEWEVNVGMNFNKERICLICGEEIKGNHWNFCSNCGTKMDGGKKNDL